jgi:GR25 family glycosyltransferase involved in LPS biosynthesis
MEIHVARLPLPTVISGHYSQRLYNREVPSESVIEVNKDDWFFPLIINLEYRVDRMSNSTVQAAMINCKLIRINAVDAHSILDVPEFLTKGAFACWESHKLAMQQLIDSPYNFALIFEDDFRIEKLSKFLRLVNNPEIFENVDIFQFGFLVNDYKERVDLIFRNLENFFFSTLGKINFSFFGKRISFIHRLRVRRKQNFPSSWVADDFRAGAHAYLVSKSAARKILKLNSPAFLTTDAFFSSLNSEKAFRIFRPQTSFVGQIDSPSSIKNWGAEVTGGAKD